MICIEIYPYKLNFVSLALETGQDPDPSDPNPTPSETDAHPRESLEGQGQGQEGDEGDTWFKRCYALSSSAMENKDDKEAIKQLKNIVEVKVKT